MPYKRLGTKIYTKASGTWKLKQTCKSIKNAKKALMLLEGLEHNTITTEQVKKNQEKKKHSRRRAISKIKKARKVKKRKKEGRWK